MAPIAGPLLAGLLMAAALSAAAIGSSLYRGAGWTFVLFNAAFFALAALALPRPRAYAYTFLALFLLLGFWFKVVFHAIAAPGFVEPVGAFAGTAAEWDRALLAAACAALGVLAARLGHLYFSRHGTAGPQSAPYWFVRWEKQLWFLTVALIVAVNAANLHFAFYQVGVKPKLLLPLRGHVVIAWLVNIGFALWVAAMVWWSYQRRRVLGQELLAPVGEALFSAISAFSRLNFIVHAVPYALALFEQRHDLRFRRNSLYKAFAALVVLFFMSLMAVFALRVYHYYGYAADARGKEPMVQHIERTIYKQMPLLLLHRWVGLEGVLAVGASGQSAARLGEALLDAPGGERQSLFQRTARTAYVSEQPERFVFLANAGPVAVLWFSGSLAVVFVGMAAIAAVLLATEELAARWTGNPFLLAVAGAALANVVSQTNFFYLTAIFLLQLWLALALLGVLQRIKLRNT